MELEELKARIKQLDGENIKRIFKPGGTIIMTSNNYYKRLVELYKAGKLPKVLKRGVLRSGFSVGGFFIRNATYSWRCLGFKGKFAEVEVRFYGEIEIQRMSKRISKLINKTFTVYIDPDTRETYTKEGEYIGIVPFWISHLKVGERVTVLGLYNLTINGTVFTDHAEVKTYLGTLKAYAINGTDVTVTFPGMRWICYDRTYGILLSTRNYVDPILHHYMNVSYVCTGSKPMVISKLELKFEEKPLTVIPTMYVIRTIGIISTLIAIIIIILTKLRRRAIK